MRRGEGTACWSVRRRASPSVTIRGFARSPWRSPHASPSPPCRSRYRRSWRRGAPRRGLVVVAVRPCGRSGDRPIAACVLRRGRERRDHDPDSDRQRPRPDPHGARSGGRIRRAAGRSDAHGPRRRADPGWRCSCLMVPAGRRPSGCCSRSLQRSPSRCTRSRPDRKPPHGRDGPERRRDRRGALRACEPAGTVILDPFWKTHEPTTDRRVMRVTPVTHRHGGAGYVACVATAGRSIS
jgi:hypothetical protein